MKHSIRDRRSNQRTWWNFTEHTTKLLGSITLSAHVPGQSEVAYELPAQSPQNVMSVCKPMNKAPTWMVNRTDRR